MKLISNPEHKILHNGNGQVLRPLSLAWIARLGGLAMLYLATRHD